MTKRIIKTGIKATGRSHKIIGTKKMDGTKMIIIKMISARMIRTRTTGIRKITLIGRRTTRCSLEKMSKSVSPSLEDG